MPLVEEKRPFFAPVMYNAGGLFMVTSMQFCASVLIFQVKALLGFGDDGFPRQVMGANICTIVYKVTPARVCGMSLSSLITGSVLCFSPFYSQQQLLTQFVNISVKRGPSE